MEDEEVLLKILIKILGKPSKVNQANHQYGFDCPVCSYNIKFLEEGDGKGNLEINTELGLYKCWVCSETHGTKGRLEKFFRVFGTPKEKKAFKSLHLEFSEEKKLEEVETLSLPEEFKSFSSVSRIGIGYKQAINYLKKRNVTDEMIAKYKIGFCESGEYSGRIIFPSFNKSGDLTYFVARSWFERKNKYKNPSIKKDSFIFNESNIDFNKDIYLVEGVFDMVFIENSIPLLGKYLHQLLIERLYNEAKKDIYIALDGDAFNNTITLYNELNSGKLRNRVKILKLPIDCDPASLEGKINNYITEIL